MMQGGLFDLDTVFEKFDTVLLIQLFVNPESNPFVFDFFTKHDLTPVVVGDNLINIHSFLLLSGYAPLYHTRFNMST